MAVRTDTWIMVAVLGVGGYFLYQALSKAGAGVRKGIDLTAGQIANLWLKMFPLPPSMELLGSVKFPGNLKVPIQQLHNEGAIKQDRETGRVFVKYANYFWELSPQVNGLWPAARVE